jgi:hypothetical protein
MARTIVPPELRELLNTKLKDAGWTSVRKFCLTTGLCTDETYSAETITRVFNARDGESKGTELFTIANVLRFLDTPMDETRAILEQYYPENQHRMIWELLGEREVELNNCQRLFLDLIGDMAADKPEKMFGLISAIEAYAMAADIDCAKHISKLKKIIKEQGGESCQ